MKEIDFELIRDMIFSRLERELSPKLYYHGVHHTRDDVLPAIERLASLAQIKGEELLLLKIAAIYHDFGYTHHYLNHEAIGAGIASQELPEFGFSAEQVRRIAGMIMATRMPQSPKNELEKLICDADLDSLGREDFFVISHSLRLELKEMGIITSVKEWYTRQLKFLESHVYLSEFGRALRTEGKNRNILELRSILNLD